ncbi:MAG: exodeoxyribonuclease VII large subunit [Myxococcales bacterium]|nr:exodeoxyribonuclease VII large subunit [Myxococcales bacterium]MDD9969293.1 exodeoxyribonuclease VII large subunit [Myxococcales bacterium]
MSTLPLFGNQPDNGGRTPRGRIYKVAQVNRVARFLLEDRFRGVWVEGELSDVTRASSGHVYFTLNDEEEEAQLRGVMFRSDAANARTRLANGARVRLRGTISLFEPRGNYQLIARVAMPQGLGDMHARFEAVRRKLEAEGLLDPQRKRALPRVPRVVGVVTSPSGAALQDIIHVSQARCPTRLVVSPCTVQGAEAPQSIVRALKAVQRIEGLSVVIVGRGGGAAEDLFAFNDERVARAIAACRVPVVSAVGHEVDVTIADLVADVRAATPSNAAERVVPEREALATALSQKARALRHAMMMRLSHARLQLDRKAARLGDPRSVMAGARARLSSHDRALEAHARRALRERRRLLASLSERLARADPRVLLAQRRGRLARLSARLCASGSAMTHADRARLGQLSGRLSAMSPLSVLARGYAIALHEPSGRALLRASDAQVGDQIRVRLHTGSLTTQVQGIDPDPPSQGPERPDGDANGGA